MKLSMELLASSAGAEAGLAIAGLTFESLWKLAEGDLCSESKANLRSVARGFAEKAADSALEGQPEPAAGHKERFRVLVIEAFLSAYMGEIERRFAARREVDHG